MQREIKTKLTLYKDSPTAVSSTVFGANLNAVAFNADYIGRYDGQLVKEIYKLYERARKLRK